MHTYQIEARYPSGQFRGSGEFVAPDPYSAVIRASQIYTWAGQSCDEHGTIWPFNPTMRLRVDGEWRRACDIAAEHVAACARRAA